MSIPRTGGTLAGWDQLISRIRISQRIYLLVALGGLLFLSAGAIHLTDNALSETAYKQAREFNDIARRVNEFSTYKLVMELSERSFSTLGDLQAYSRFVMASRRSSEILTELEAMDGTRAIDSDLTLLRIRLREITALFARLYSLSTTIGLTAEDGLWAKLRDSVDVLQDELASWPYMAEVNAKMQQARRHELAYQLHKRPEDLGLHRKAINELEFALFNSSFDPDALERITGMVAAYRQKLEEFGSVAERRRNTVDSLLTVIDDMEPMIERLLVFTEDGKQTTQLYLDQTQERIHTILFLSGGLAPLIFALLALPVARSIARPITDISTTMRRLAEGEHGIVVPGIDRRDEIADMARAITYFVEVIDRRETALRESERRFRDFAETSADCFYETDRSLRFSYVSNHEFVRDRVLPWALDRVLGVDPEMLLDRRSFRDEEFGLTEGDLTEGDLTKGDLGESGGDATNPAGTRNVRTFLVSGKPVIDRAARFTGYRGSIVEITCRKQAEKQIEVARLAAERALTDLTELQESLIQAEKMASLGQLVAGVAHEINTPVGIGLTAASHLEQLLASFRIATEGGRLRRSDLNTFTARIDETVSLLTSNLNRAAELIQSFKSVAVDQTSAERRHFDLGAYLREILLSLKPELKRTAHTVSIDCPSGIEMHSYPGPLSQVLTNLIMNSVIHAFDEGVAGQITITARSLPYAWVEIVYRDSGRGIHPKNLSRIFEPFYTTRRGRGGSGLGLHVTYNCVTQALGGRLTVDSTLGEGATFTVAIPCTSTQ